MQPRVKGQFIWVNPSDSGVPPFWLRSSDIVGVRPGDGGDITGCTLMRHATTPLVVDESADDMLDLLAEAEGWRVLAVAGAADTD